MDHLKANVIANFLGFPDGDYSLEQGSDGITMKGRYYKKGCSSYELCDISYRFLANDDIPMIRRNMSRCASVTNEALENIPQYSAPDAEFMDPSLISVGIVLSALDFAMQVSLVYQSEVSGLKALLNTKNKIGGTP